MGFLDTLKKMVQGAQQSAQQSIVNWAAKPQNYKTAQNILKLPQTTLSRGSFQVQAPDVPKIVAQAPVIRDIIAKDTQYQQNPIYKAATIAPRIVANGFADMGKQAWNAGANVPLTFANKDSNAFQKAKELTLGTAVPMAALIASGKLANKLLPNQMINKVIPSASGPIVVGMNSVKNQLLRAAGQGAIENTLFNAGAKAGQGTMDNEGVKQILSKIAKSTPEAVLSGSVLSSGAKALQLNSLGNRMFNPPEKVIAESSFEIPTSKKGKQTNGIEVPSSEEMNTQLKGNNYTPINIKEILKKQGTEEMNRVPITEKEVLKAASEVVDPRIKPMTRAEQVIQAGKEQAYRNQIAKDVQTFTNNPTVESVNKIYENIKTDTQLGSQQGVLLRMRQIEADPNISPIHKILKMMRDNGVDIESDKIKAEVLSMGKDWNNPAKVVDFWRKNIPAKLSDWMSVYRYNNMLSNFGTLEGNIESNLFGSAVTTPIQKTLEGIGSFVQSKVTGKQQQRFAGEGGAYLKGFFTKEGANAAKKSFKDAFSSGIDSITEIDKYGDARGTLTQSKSPMRIAENALKVFTNFLKGTDNYFTELTKRGIKKSLEYRQNKSGIKIDNIDNLSFAEARKILFNNPLGEVDEGILNNAISGSAQWINSLKMNKSGLIRGIANHVFPFIKIGSNLLKESVNYSPSGYLNLLGSNPDRLQTFVKATMGTGLTMALLPYAMGDNITLSPPTSQKERDMQTRSGISPNSIRIGDKWFYYGRMHPSIQSPIIFAGAMAKAEKNPKNFDKGYLEKIGQAFGDWWMEQTNQSYFKNIGDFAKILQGDDTATARFMSNIPKQYVPFQGFLNWVNQALDTTKHKIDADADFFTKTLQSINMNIPGLSGGTPEVVDTFGNPIQKPSGVLDKAWNMGIAERFTRENKQEKQIYDLYLKNKNEKQNKENSVKNIIKSQQTTPSQSTSQSGVFNSTGNAAMDLLIKQQQEKDRVKTITDILTRKGDYKDVPQGNDFTQKLLIKENVTKEDIRNAELNAIKSLGTKETVDYIRSKPSVDFTQLYKSGALTATVAQEMERQGYIKDADELMKKMKSTDVYYQNKAVRQASKSSMKKMLSAQKKAMKKALTVKVKKYKSPKMPKMKKVKLPKIKSYKIKKL